MKKLENIFLYLVVLGGRAKKANIEIHDVRWVVGSKIEDTYDTLRKDWFGSPKGLHIDSYKKIKHIDGYKINLINFERDKKDAKQLVQKISLKKIYGLSILEAIIQLLCKKNMNLDWLQLKLNLRQKIKLNLNGLLAVKRSIKMILLL